MSGGPNIIQLHDIVQNEQTKTASLVNFFPTNNLKIFEHVDAINHNILYKKLTDIDVRYYIFRILEVIPTS